jgi:type II secretory pathway pseudopilin PulG
MNDAGDSHLELTPQDQDVLDALVEAGFDPAAVEQMPAERRPRAERMSSLMNMLRDYPVEDGDDTLVHATLARIHRYDAAASRRMSFADRKAELNARRVRRFRLPDLISVAAVLLIGMSIVFPLLSNLQKERDVLKSQNNLQYVTHAVNSYALDHGGDIPTARAGLMDTWNTFTDTINLTPLVRANYFDINDPAEQKRREVRADQFRHSNLVLFLGDRNPIIDAIREGRMDEPMRIELGVRRDGRRILTEQGAILWLGQAAPPMNNDQWSPRAVMWLQDDIRPEPRTD